LYNFIRGWRNIISKKIPNKEYFQNKKLITISPGGYKGVYMYGICSYIKENYNLSDYIFSGASAGAWNSLMMTCKKDISQFKKDIINYSIDNSNNIFEKKINNKIK